jgi:methylenetetrahydrofolate dehydrogenase (NADP+) / methenyltetrahydrofolate cyclohydrolase
MIIDGAAMAKNFKQTLIEKIQTIKQSKGITPSLAVIIVGEDEASLIYVGRKVKDAKEIGMDAKLYHFPANTKEQTLIHLIEQLNANDSVHGILVQLPLPAHLQSSKIINVIDHRKDVDGLTIINTGKIFANLSGLYPCTPMACLEIIKFVNPNLTGLDAVIIGCSEIVGKPLAHLLLAQGCTVTITHSKTRNLSKIARRADILISAAGVPVLVKSSWVKKGAIVIDVGINRLKTLENKTLIKGDVDFEEVKDIAFAITPVPGGVGPMTVAHLLNNTIIAANLQLEK